MARATDGNEQLLCSFCGKSQRQVKKLIAGPGVYICDECIDLCNEIIDEELTSPAHLDLDNLPRPKDIYLYVNSPGGDVYSGLAVYDTMQFVKPDVSTIGIGMAMSMGALLLAGGAAGKRMALPNAKVMIHQVWTGGFGGQATDIEIRARETLSLKRRIEEIIAKHANQELEKVTKDMERDYFLSSEEAKDYGIIDRVIEHR